ncbi:MAG: T9SS type A sorting domain-containing protein [Bacteroidales bacterium]|nr:T9SS type A sorting domain-containing protein [Bacteroidales bacterium]
MKNLVLIILIFIGISDTVAINTPTQSSPASGTVNLHTNTVLWINQVTGATEYDYLLDTVPTYDSPALRTKTHSSSFGGWTTNDLFYGKTYYWKIRARNTTDTSAWSSTWTFTTHSIGVSQSSPASNALQMDLSLVLWINRLGSENYDYQLDTVPTFDSPDLQEYTHTDVYGGQTVNDLRYGKKYYWRVRGRNSSDTSNWTGTWNFTTKNYGVTLQSPYNNTTNIDPQISLFINKVTGSENYDYQLDTVSTFDSPNLKEFSHTSSYSGWAVSDLRYGQKYYWRARGRNSSDTSNWTGTWNFTTKNYGVTLQSPYNNTTNIDPQISLFINKVTGSENYDYQLDTVSTFDSPNLKEFSHTSSYSGWAVSDLRYGQKYYWRARGRNSSDTSNWTGTWNFTTKNYGVTLQSPYNNTTSIPPLIALFINKVTGSDNYDYQLDTLSTFDSPDLQEFSHTNSYSGWSVSDLRYNKKYYWRARGRNDTDTSGWTGTWNFTTKVYGATPSSPASGSISISTNTTLWLNKVTGSDNYDYQIDTSLNFNSPLLAEYTHSSTYSGIGISLTRYGQKYYWRVRGRNDTDTSRWSSAWNLTTFFELTESPVLIAPANGSIGITYSSVSLDWNSIASVSSYQYEVSTSNDFSALIKSGTTSLTDRTITGLDPNTVYYWRIRGENSNGFSPWSEVWSFTTETTTMTAPVLISPANSATNISSTSIDFSWQSVFGANEYIFEISQDNTFTTGVTTQNISNTSNNLVALNENTTYYWRVASTDGYTTSSWSDVWNFTTEGTLLAPSLISPSDNATNQLTDITLSWSAVTNAASYEYQYSTDNSFSTYISGTTNNTDFLISGLNNNTTYYWKVNATDGTNYSAWSEIWSFTTENNSKVGNINNINTDIYPNPADNVFNIKSDIVIDYINITDISGKEVYSSKKADKEFTIQTNNFTEGIYIIKLFYSDKREVKKIIITH